MTEKTITEQVAGASEPRMQRCPVAHNGKSDQKTAPSSETLTPALEQDAAGVWQVRGTIEARTLLRSSTTKQAGFNAEMITVATNSMTNQPILYLEGKEHNKQRAQTARFFTPKTVSTTYRADITALVDTLIDELKRTRHADLSQLSLTLAVLVACRVVGLTNSSLKGRAKRLDAFFSDTDSLKPITSPILKWKPINIAYEIFRQRGILLFYLLDVRPAIRERRKKPQEDVISYLLEQHYSDRQILTECVTYAAAGMVTTREFISLATWHFLEQPELRARYLVAPEAERMAMLHEILRLEPVVGHLFRRATADITLTSEGKPVTIREGDLVDIHIYATNADTSVVGEDPLALCPGRTIHGEGIQDMVMSFGDGAHRCPGAFLAMAESDIFLQQLLALDNVKLEHDPKLTWHPMTLGYELRDFAISLA